MPSILNRAAAILSSRAFAVCCMSCLTTFLRCPFRENIKRLEGTGLTFDLCALPHQIDKVTALADLAPDVQFVLDHCGVPDIKSGALESWQKGISEIAQRENVVAKISGVVAYADPASWTVDTVRPYVEHVIDAFGWERIVWEATGRSAH